MANKELSQAAAIELLRTSNDRSKAAQLASRTWLRPDDYTQLAKAVKKKQPFVIIQGRRFKIKYTMHYGGSVYIEPDGWGFVPCGFYSYKTLDDKLVEAGEHT